MLAGGDLTAMIAILTLVACMGTAQSLGSVNANLDGQGICVIKVSQLLLY